MGQRDGLSYYDIQKIGRMYNCERQQPIFNAVAVAKPIINAIAGANKNSDRGFQFGREFFNTYTSPQFWQRLFNSWVFPPQRQRYPERTYNDYGFYGFRY